MFQNNIELDLKTKLIEGYSDLLRDLRLGGTALDQFCFQIQFYSKRQ